MPSRTISNTASELFPQNRMRVSFAIQNEDQTIDCFIKQEEPGNTTVSTTDHDHRLSPGSSLALSSLLDGKNSIQQRYTIVAASGTPRISILETEEKDR